MKKVFIKHNPYKLETEILVDGKELKGGKIGEIALKAPGSSQAPRLQDWIEEFPKLLIKDLNDDLEITFHGTQLDYDDLQIAFEEACKLGIIKTKVHYCAYKPVKEISDKKALLDKIYNEIQQINLFNEVHRLQVQNAFEDAKNSDFSVYVVATMSAGKSTLINAMLGQLLMPSRLEACTAKVTKIKDISAENIPFKAEVYDKKNNLKKEHETLTLQIMDRLNSDEDVSVIKVSGNIPFVSSDDVSLVLIDTPGPTYAHDPQHKKVFDELMDTESKPLVLYITSGSMYQTTDDDNLLRDVARSMSAVGKQSKDRFMFVLNKVDEFDPSRDSVVKTLEGIRLILKENYGIVNPNLFPAAAELALNIRMSKNGVDVDNNIRMLTEFRTKKLNMNQVLHLENYAALPDSISGEIKRQLEKARASYNGKSDENPDEALIHTGVISIEAAIRQYVQKYAKTAKISTFVETFINNLNAQGSMEEAKRAIAQNRAESDKIAKQIDSIRKKINDAKEAAKFKKDIDDAVASINEHSEKTVESIVQNFQIKISERVDALPKGKIDSNDALFEIKNFEKFVNKLDLDFEKKLEELIRKILDNTSSALLAAYRKKLASLNEDVDVKGLGDLKIDPLKLTGGGVIYDDSSFRKLIKTKRIADGEEEIEVPSKVPIIGPVIDFIFGPDKKSRTTYVTQKYVKGEDMSKILTDPARQIILDKGDATLKYAKEQSEKIEKQFAIEIKRLDGVLEANLAELEKSNKDKTNADERIKEAERKLDQIEQIKAKVESILEI